MDPIDGSSRPERPVIWIGTSKDDIFVPPGPVKGSFGHRLGQMQQGGKPHDAKALTQFGTGVFELREGFDGNAYRLMVVVKLKKAIYLLHAFMKKSKSGTGLPRKDAELVHAWLKCARELDRE
jgi:phage-related protein